MKKYRFIRISYGFKYKQTILEKLMIKECNFKSKIRHRDFQGCQLTPPDVVCPGEDNCILFQIYVKLEKGNE